MSSSILDAMQILADLTDDHAAWFSRAVRGAVYPDFGDAEEGESQKKDDLHFAHMMGQLRQSGLFPDDVVSMLESQKAAIVEKAQSFICGTEGRGEPGTPPIEKEFSAFLEMNETFFARLAQAAKEIVAENNGIDDLTGLRSKAVMLPEIDRELERRARRGNPFVLIYAQVDSYEDLEKIPDGPVLRETKKRFAALIKKVLRTCDDVYLYSGFSYILCLKHTELNGAMSAVKRLRRLLEQSPLSVPDKNSGPLTISCCLTEPVPGEKAQDIIEALRHDLETNSSGPDSVIQLVETSPLERFVNLRSET